MDCGCDTRKQTLNTDHDGFVNAAITGGAVLLLLSTYGGQVSSKTHKLVSIAAFGAITALIVDGYIKPTFFGK